MKKNIGALQKGSLRKNGHQKKKRTRKNRLWLGGKGGGGNKSKRGVFTWGKKNLLRKKENKGKQVWGAQKWVGRGTLKRNQKITSKRKKERSETVGKLNSCGGEYKGGGEFVQHPRRPPKHAVRFKKKKKRAKEDGKRKEFTEKKNGP